MTTYNTGNALGSSDARDLYDNAENFDKALNGTSLTWVDRRGVTRPTWQGAIEDGITAAELAADDGASKIGYIPASTGAVPTDVQTKLREIVSINDNDSQAALDAAQRSILVTSGTHAATVATPAGSYHGEGVLTVGNLSLNLLNNQAPKIVDTVFLGDLSTIDAAISDGAAKVVFWGDSITEGISQVAYEDSFPGLIQAHLQDTLPRVDWSFENYAIAGSTASDAANASYIGAASDSYPTQFYRKPGAANAGNFQRGTPLWPDGSTIGKSWREHVRDSEPDLLIFAFGANSISTDPGAYANTLGEILIYVATWSKVPSIVFVTNLQATRKDPDWLNYNINLQKIAEVTRTVGRQNNVTVVDANRLHLVYRDGLDVCRPSKRLSYQFSGGYSEAWPAGWETSGTAPSITGVYNLAFSAPAATEKIDSATDVNISAIFVPTIAANSAIGIVYRSDGVSDDNKYTAYVFTNSDASASTCVLYCGLTAIASGAVDPVTNAEQVQIDVECVGARHVVKVRGVISIDILDYRKLDAGQYGVRFGAGSGVVANWVARVGNYRVVGAPQLTDDIVYGAVDDWLTNDASLGGDTIHHPTAIGHKAVYLAAFAWLLNRLEASANRPKSRVVVASTTDTITALAANEYLDLVIAGVSNGAVLLSTCTADASIGATVAHIKQVTGTSVTVSVLKNGAQFMSQTLSLAGGGDWLVIASGTASEKSGLKRHTLTAAAIKL